MSDNETNETEGEPMIDMGNGIVLKPGYTLTTEVKFDDSGSESGQGRGYTIERQELRKTSVARSDTELANQAIRSLRESYRRKITIGLSIIIVLVITVVILLVLLLI